MMDTGSQMIFSSLDYGFRWVGDWYEYDGEDAEKAARKARDAKASEFKKAGRRVKKFSLGKQLMSRGGIGSGRPHIELWTKAYGLNYSK